MHLFMQQPIAGPVPPRYIRLSLGQDLLGSWELVRETGQIGGRMQVRREIFTDCDKALSAFDDLRSQFAKRGYAVPEALPTSASHF
jgi:predicted DNA-binding WGR domain protein